MNNAVNAEPKSFQIDAMRAVLESMPSTTTAVKALIACLCEIDALPEATLLEGLLERLAEVESATL